MTLEEIDKELERVLPIVRKYNEYVHILQQEKERCFRKTIDDAKSEIEFVEGKISEAISKVSKEII